MAGISKRISGAWVSGDERVMETATDTITTLPADLYADGTNATVGLKGNMQQTGTPSPTNPIYPSETGDKTANLLDINSTWRKQSTSDIISVSDNSVTITSSYYAYLVIPVKENTNYTISFTVNGSTKLISGYNSSPFTSSNQIFTTSTSPTIFNSGATNKLYMLFYAGTGTQNTTTYSNIMLVEGSTAPSSYIPYGYKIPISSANTTTPVYLGEVQSTRQIKKYEFTGQETWYTSTSSSNRYRAYISLSDVSGSTTCICSHYQYSDSQLTYPDVNNCYINSVGTFIVGINSADFADVTVWKNYLSDQYANGTPVTIWYVLATPTTGIVNEPIRKIGDYADTVSGITIPTITGADSFDVLTTLKPSEVSLTYHGWHEGTVHERENGQWD